MIQENIQLQAYNTFGIPVCARYFVEINTHEDLELVRQWHLIDKVPRLVLGGGSNILFTQDFGGLVIKVGLKGKLVSSLDENLSFLKLGAGEVWHDTVLFTIEEGLGGIENLSLIPGTVGAAPIQNIGAYGVELKDVFESLEAYDLLTGEFRTFNHVDCEFGYRYSVFKNSLKGHYIITSVTLRLTKKPVINSSYGAIQEVLDDAGILNPGIKDVSDAVIQIRQSKLPDPGELGNAGSFFKNPEISEEAFQNLKAKFPDVVSYPGNNGLIKVPAGWLIDRAGWKGKKQGNVGVHSKQALVLVNHGGGTGEAVKELAYAIKQDVWDKFGVEIVPEVNIL